MNWQTNQSFAPGVPGGQFDTLSMSNYGQMPGPLGSGTYPSLVSPSAPAMGSDWTQGFAPKTGNPTAFGGADFKLGAPAEAGNWWDGALDKPGQQGWGGLALGGVETFAKVFMGMQQYGLAKKQLAENQRQFDTNFAAQKGLTNSNLEDRQRARVASNAGAYESVGNYMNKNGVK